MASTTKAITILTKIGNDILDDCDVREALLSVARLPESESGLQLRLAAIDALGEINKYRGVQFSGDDEDPIEESDLLLALQESEKLTVTAHAFLEDLLTPPRYDDTETAPAAASTPIVIWVVAAATPKPTPTPTPIPPPTPTPTPIPPPRDQDF